MYVVQGVIVRVQGVRCSRRMKGLKFRVQGAGPRGCMGAYVVQGVVVRGEAEVLAHGQRVPLASDHHAHFLLAVGGVTLYLSLYVYLYSI